MRVGKWIYVNARVQLKTLHNTGNTNHLACSQQALRTTSLKNLASTAKQRWPIPHKGNKEGGPHPYNLEKKRVRNEFYHPQMKENRANDHNAGPLLVQLRAPKSGPYWCHGCITPALLKGPVVREQSCSQISSKVHFLSTNPHTQKSEPLSPRNRPIYPSPTSPCNICTFHVFCMRELRRKHTIGILDYLNTELGHQSNPDIEITEIIREGMRNKNTWFT